MRANSQLVAFLNYLGGALLIISSIYGSAQSSDTNSPALTCQPPACVHGLRVDGLDNYFQLSERVYSGSAPENEAAFAALKASGVKTIISVDGAKPDTGLARRYGMRYVHLPFGYDGIPTNRILDLVKAARVLPSPLYVHCHHGSHRGPAAAAVMCTATEGWTSTDAEAWLKLAGTSTNYVGLFRSVRRFVLPTTRALEDPEESFQETVRVAPLADTMVEIDRRLDHLTVMKSAGYARPESDPDLIPAHEALLLHESFRELRRSPIALQQGREFCARLEEAESAARAFHCGLTARPIDVADLNTAFARITEACAACHKVYRN